MWISIVGSAGRREDGPAMSKRLYTNCFKHLRDELLKDIPIQDRKLISGGAAWMDHLAVSLYLSDLAASLTLCLPATFCITGEETWGNKHQLPCYDDTGEVDWRHNPGGTTNYYHKLFSKHMGSNTLEGIAAALAKGAEKRDHYQFLGGSPFHARNMDVGATDLLIAFTWGEGSVPKDGGTKHTWDHSNAERKIHVPLASMR